VREWLRGVPPGRARNAAELEAASRYPALFEDAPRCAEAEMSEAVAQGPDSLSQVTQPNPKGKPLPALALAPTPTTGPGPGPDPGSDPDHGPDPGPDPDPGPLPGRSGEAARRHRGLGGQRVGRRGNCDGGGRLGRAHARHAY